MNNRAETSSVAHASFSLQRTYPSNPARVFAAFADASVKRRWFVEGKGWEIEHYACDFRVGGHERSRFRFRRGPGTPAGAPPDGTPMGNDSFYLDIVPERRIVLAYSMSIGERPFSASLVTIQLEARAGGTELLLTEQGAYFEGSDGPELRRQGWGGLLARLEAELARGEAG